MVVLPATRIEGGLLGPDVLDQLLAGDLPGQKPADFGLEARRNLTDEIAAAFVDARAMWGVFQHRLQRLPESDLATTVTRDAWVIPFLGLLGFEARFNSRAHEVDALSFAISHRAGDAEDSPPVHIVGARQELGRVPASGRPRLAPHSLVQEYLNRTEHLWGLVTNGLTLRLLRNSSFVRRQAYVEFDLTAIFDEQRFQDFTVLYRLLHRTRLPRGLADASQCLLEQYYARSIEQGGRVREHLREGVEECIERLANGFLSHRANDDLRRRAAPDCTGNERIPPGDLYRQLLRLVYRFLFLLVSEDRGLLSRDPVYHEHYGIARLRGLLDSRAAYSADDDLWQGLRVLWRVLCDERLATFLRVAPLNGELFAPQALDHFTISNRDLLEAFWRLAWYRDKESGPPRRVNYAALDVEELGSVYESLLEFHPDVRADGSGRLEFRLVFGSERKTTGSYYTPLELVNELVQSALEPVLKERLAAVRDKAPTGQASTEERVILSIRVCDPACGSGHFLLAAARRLGKELARVRAGEGEPAPERVREAVRDVISHCIYGVDRNPLAVDLCRVALWLEGHTAEKPLTFLDHRIRCGDSLAGVFELAALKKGIPDKAFDAMEGDDKTAARQAARRNREERAGQRDFFAGGRPGSLDDVARLSRELDQIPDDSPEEIRRKKRLFEQGHADAAWLRQKETCDLWTAAFFQRLTQQVNPISTSALADHMVGGSIDPRILGNATALSQKLRFFHWPLEFPEVIASGGFDVLLSNPPWERIKLQEQEFFATRDSEIAAAPNKAARARLIAELPQTNPALAAEFIDATHEADCVSKFLRQSGRFPMTATGDINTYAVFAETIRCLIAPNGRAGMILPTGIATDDTTKKFFSDLIEKKALARLVGYENESFIFPAIANVVRFCTFTIAGAEATESEPKFAFYIRLFSQLSERERFFQLTANDFALLNPNTRTCPVFRTQTDAALTRKIYQRVPVLDREGRPDGNPWGISFSRMIDMANDSELFHDASGEGLLPLYEGKLIWHYDHRFGSYEFKGIVRGKGGRGLPETPLEKSQDPSWRITPQYWVAEAVVQSRLSLFTKKPWLVAFRDVTSAKLERSAVFTFLPVAAVGHKAPLIFVSPTVEVDLELCLVATLNSLVFDFVTRQKLGGTSLSYFVLKQLPVLPPGFFGSADAAYVALRVVELIYTADDMSPLADALRASASPIALSVSRTPYRWDEARRAVVRAELDAWMARAYGLTRDELRYVLDPQEVFGPEFPGETFRVLKEKEQAKFGEYRTRRLVLEAWDRLPPPSGEAQAMAPRSASVVSLPLASIRAGR